MRWWRATGGPPHPALSPGGGEGSDKRHESTGTPRSRAGGRAVWLGLALGLGLVLAGCGLRIPDDVGTLVTDEAQLPGAGKPYPLPELGDVGQAEPTGEAPVDLPTQIKRALEKR